jgi:hypothetical protein
VTDRQSLGKFFKHMHVQRLSPLKIADAERFLALLGSKAGHATASAPWLTNFECFFRFGEQMAWTKPGMAFRVRCFSINSYGLGRGAAGRLLTAAARVNY